MPVTSKQTRQLAHSLRMAYSSGTTTLAVSVGSTWNWQLHEVRFNLSTGQGSGGDFSITINSSVGAIHDFVLCSQNMIGLQDLQYHPDEPVQLSAGDKVDMAWPNNTTNKFGLEVIYGNRE